ncbi:MAG: DUF4381 domain-containing protein [Roseibium sp.]
MKDEWKDLNLAELLDLLEPVPEPPQVSMMPQTQGWIWLGAVLLVVLVLAARYFLKRWRGNAYRRQALRELRAGAGDVPSLAALVRRTALAAYPRSEIAGLHGRDWLTFLDRAYGGDEFSTGAGRLLASAPYRTGDKVGGQTLESLHKLVAIWIRRHGGPVS